MIRSSEEAWQAVVRQVRSSLSSGLAALVSTQRADIGLLWLGQILLFVLSV